MTLIQKKEKGNSLYSHHNLVMFGYFNSTVTIPEFWTKFSKFNIRNFLDKIPEPNGGTDLNKAIRYSTDTLLSHDMYSYENKICILTDGRFNSSVIEESNKAKGFGIKIYAIYIKRNSSTSRNKLLDDITTNGYLTCNNVNNLWKSLSKNNFLTTTSNKPNRTVFLLDISASMRSDFNLAKKSLTKFFVYQRSLFNNSKNRR